MLQAINSGMPVYAECAGLMYLTKTVADFDGNTHMTTSTLVTYSQAQVITPNVLSSPDAVIRGHEFHNSIITDIPQDAKFAYRMLMGEGIKDKKDGWTRKNTLALYMYIQFAQDHAIAQTFIGKCRNWKP